jgi:hypothetical protein
MSFGLKMSVYAGRLCSPNAAPIFFKFNEMIRLNNTKIRNNLTKRIVPEKALYFLAWIQIVSNFFTHQNENESELLYP